MNLVGATTILKTPVLRTDASGVVGAYHASRAIDDAIKALFS